MVHNAVRHEYSLAIFPLTSEFRIRGRAAVTSDFFVFLRLSVGYYTGNRGKNKEPKKNEKKYTSTRHSTPPWLFF